MGPLTGSTINDLLSETVAHFGDRIATLEPTPDGVRSTTYAQLAEEVAATRTRLLSHGLARGDRVAYWAENRREFLVWHFAAAAEGIALVGTNTRYRAVEVAHVFERVRPALVVMPERLLELPLRELLHAAAERAAETPGWRPPQIAVLGPVGDSGALRDDTVLSAFDLGAGAWWADEPADAHDGLTEHGRPDDPAIVFTTSGSTGMPKLAAHDQRSVARHAREVAKAVGYGESDVFFAVLPVTGVFSYVPAIAAVAAGATTLMVPVFDKAAAIRLMHDHRVTHTFGGDDLYDGLFRGWQGTGLRLDSWRVAGVASFIGRVEQLLPWLAECSSAAMVGVYGSSEVFSLVAIRGLGEPPLQRHLGGGRLVSDGIEVRAVDPATGRAAEAGTVGQLQFRGYNVLQAYVQAEELRPPHLEDSWFDSGDLGTVEPDGCSFTYAGRAGDALRLRGFLVQPSEIELFLIEHPAISGAKVVGVDNNGRDEAVAFVTVEPGASLDPEQVLTWCRAELAAFKAPSRVVVIDEMPVTAGTNGSKVRTVELRKLAQELTAS